MNHEKNLSFLTLVIHFQHFQDYWVCPGRENLLDLLKKILGSGGLT